jgi:hypothetical protein
MEDLLVMICSIFIALGIGYMLGSMEGEGGE